MVRLHKISTALIAVFCLLSFSGIYLINAACLTNDIVISLTESHLGDHQHHKATDTDSRHERHHSDSENGKCCSGATFKYISLAHALVPQIASKGITLSYITPIFFSQSLFIPFNEYYSWLWRNNNGPPKQLISGALVRVLIQSFQI